MHGLANFKVNKSITCSRLRPVLPMILVRNQIRDMLGRERQAKLDSEELCKNSGLPSNKNSSLCTKYWYAGNVQTLRLL